MDYKNTLEAFRDLTQRQGGDLKFTRNTFYSLGVGRYASAIKVPDGYKPFKVSVYNSSDDIDVISLILLVNPKDIQIGQVFISSSAYTRKSWVSTLWGQQQSTISANGTSGGFYLSQNGQTGLVNFNRKNTITFINFMSLLSMFKNNGANFNQAQTEKTYFGTGLSRVIDVLDSMKISYDGTEYTGEFISFTTDEDATSPYKISYSFEFIISGSRGDKVEGHINNSKYNSENGILISLQGDDNSIVNSIQYSDEDLQRTLNFGSVEEDLDDAAVPAAYIDSTISEEDQDEAPPTLEGIRVEDPVGNTGKLIQAYRDSGMSSTMTRRNAAFKLGQIKSFQENVAAGIGKNITAEQALERVNSYVTNGGEVNTEMMTSILLMEAWDKDKNGYVDVSNAGARGITQIIPGTYSGIANNEKFVNLMEEFGYSKEQIDSAHLGLDKDEVGLLEKDPFFSYMAGAFYVANDVSYQAKRKGYEPDPRVIGFGYNTGPGRIGVDKIPPPDKNGKKSFYESPFEYAVTIDEYYDLIKEVSQSNKTNKSGTLANSGR